MLHPYAVLAQVDDSQAESEARSRDEADGEVDREPPKALEGIWPSPKLLKSMLVRWVEEAGEKFELDEDQRGAVRDLVVERWEKYLTEHRAEIQPLVNEFIEMRMELTPPPKEKVQAWTEKALPVFEKSKQQILETQDAFRQVLKPGQRVEFELEAFKMNAGMGLAEEKMRQWRGGEFGKFDFWEPLPKDRPARREERRKQRAEQEAAEAAALAERAPDDQIAVEVDRWEKFVADFNERFGLDEGQRNAAFSFLKELKNRALAHRDRHREEIGDLERKIARFGGDDKELDELKAKLTALYGPIDEMFAELETRLEKLPTTEQRASATQEEKKVPGANPE